MSEQTKFVCSNSQWGPTLIINGDMESNSNWHAKNGSFEGLEFSSSVIRSTEQKYSKNYSMKLTKTGGGWSGMYSDTFPVIDTEYYHVQGKFWGSTDNPNFQVWMYSGGGSRIKIYEKWNEEGPWPYGQWNSFAFDYQESGGGSNAYFFVLYGPNDGAYLYLDDVLVGQLLG